MPPEEIERLLAQAEPRFRAAWLAVLVQIRDARTIEQLAELLGAGRIDEAMRVFDAAAQRLGAVWNDEFVAAGAATATSIEGEFGRIGRGEVVVDFDRVNTRAVRAMQENNLRLVSEFSDQQRRATRQALIRGVTAGANPREQARAFRDSIGLTTRQERAVDNYRRALRDLDGAALSRRLRDRRFDGTVRRAIREGEPLSEAQIDRMVRRYRERFRKHRAEVIARTESLRSVHRGSREMFEQSIESGLLSADQLTREWNTAGDGRVRDFSGGAQTSHQSMQGQKQVGMDEPFVSGAGNRALIPTEFGVGFEDIQCRCVVGTRMSLEGVPQP